MSSSVCWLVRNTSTFFFFLSSVARQVRDSNVAIPVCSLPLLSAVHSSFLPPVCQSFCLLSLSTGESPRRICPNQLFCLFRIVSISNLSSCSSCIYLLVKFHQFSLSFFSKILDHSHCYVTYTLRFSCFISFIACSISSLSRLRPSSHKKNVDDYPLPPLTLA